jgi:hypothetical protein
MPKEQSFEGLGSLEAKHKAELQARENDHEEAKQMNKRLDASLREVAEIKGKPETPSVSTPERTAAEKEMISDWENLYKKYFPDKVIDLSRVEIPERTSEEEKEFTRLIVRAEGITNKMLFKKCAELFPSVNHTGENLDEAKDFVKRPAGAYAIWVRDAEEADEKHKNKSANMAEKEKLNAETLTDRLLHELKYFSETGKHLDEKTVTFTGSRHSDGNVLRADWYDGKFLVNRYGSDFRNDGCRFRQVVSSPTKSEK